MITILLADDHQMVRQGLCNLLSAEPDFHIVADVGDGLEALRLLERLRPDVLIVDLMMPGLNGIEVTRQTAQISPRTRVIVLSMHANEAYVAEALRYGASGYVLKESSTSELVCAVRESVAGRRFLSSPLTQAAVDDYLARSRESDGDPYNTLTNREREVLYLTAEGLTSQHIADQLFISPRTVETHRANLLRKLRLNSHSELIRYAIECGLVKGSGLN